MTSRSNFITRVFCKNKTLTFSTLSPNGQYFFKIKEPNDLYWGLFCSPIAFFDNDNNLIYHNQNQYAQFGLTQSKPWSIVSWSKSGDIAYFVERNSTKTFYHILLDLKNKKISKTEYSDNSKDKWTSELFSQLPQDKAQEAYYKIISTPAEKNKEVFEYVLTLTLIDDKRELIKALEQFYFGDDKKTLQQIDNGNFDQSIVNGNFLNDFKDIYTDKIKLNFYEYLGLWTWRPK